MLFKILSKIDNDNYNGRYLGEEKKMSFGRQNSGHNQDNFTLYKDTQIPMQFDCIKERPNIGDMIQCDGHFIDYTKMLTPEPVFVAVKLTRI